MSEVYLNCPKDIQFSFPRETQARQTLKTQLLHTHLSCQMQLKGQVRAGSRSHAYKGSLCNTREETGFWLIWDYTTYTIGEKEHVSLSYLEVGLT